MAMWKIIKRYGHEAGLSCVFKQFRAPETHCSFLHGYALAFTVCFEGDELDDRNWLISFGDLKPFKAWLEDSFDHKLLVSAKDPDLTTILDLEQKKIAQVRIVPEVGCEAFARQAYEWLNDNLMKLAPRQALEDVRVKWVEVSEHAGNTARYEPRKSMRIEPADPITFDEPETTSVVDYNPSSEGQSILTGGITQIINTPRPTGGGMRVTRNPASK